MATKTARIYWDADSDPQNPGWVLEIEATQEQHPLTVDEDADDDDLLADAAGWVRGKDITIEIERPEVPHAP